MTKPKPQPAKPTSQKAEAIVPVPSLSNLVTLSLPRPVVEQILGGLMSAISQRAYGSHWITGTETSLPFVAAKTLDTYPKDGGMYTWGQSGVGIEEAHTLTALAEALGYWVKWDEAEKGYKPYLG